MSSKRQFNSNVQRAGEAGQASFRSSAAKRVIDPGRALDTRRRPWHGRDL
jgi:hypothetical protein